MAAPNVTKTLTDAGYIAVGLGVMGFQQAQHRGRELRKRLDGAGGCIASRATDFRTQADARRRQIDEQSLAARTRAEEQVRATVARATDLRDAVQTRLGELPERVVQVMEPVSARVRELVGTAA